MCTPLLALGIAGAVVQGVAGYSQAKTQQANYQARAKAADRDAEIKREQSSYEAARTTEQGQKIIGRQIAGYASSGIAPGTGTPLEVITGTGADVALDIAASRWGYGEAAKNDQYRARVARVNASAAGAAAPLAFLSPVISGIGTALRSTYSGTYGGTYGGYTAPSV